MQKIVDALPKFLRKIIVRFLTDHFFDKYGLFIWRKVILKLSTNTNVVPYEIGTKFSESRVSKRL
jgi:hypothetical protein